MRRILGLALGLALGLTTAHAAPPLTTQASPGVIVGEKIFNVLASPYNAKGDGATNDTAAIAAAISAAAAAGGVVYLPQTALGYCATGGLTVSAPSVTLRGDNQTILSACGANVTTLTLNGIEDGVEGLNIQGPQFVSGSAPTGDALAFGIGCSRCHALHVRAQWGRHAVNHAGSNIDFTASSASLSYGTSVYYSTFSVFIQRSLLNQPPPAGNIVGLISAPAPWAATTGYVRKSLVTVTDGASNVFRLQEQTAGSCTSGGSVPAPANYGVNITDGSCTWQLASGTTPYYALQLDTGAVDNYLEGMDISSASYDYAIGLTNTGSGSSPGATFLLNVNTGDELFGMVYAHDGNQINIVNGNNGPCHITGCIGIETLANFKGDLHLDNVLMAQYPIGVKIGVGVNTSIIGGNISGSTTEAILIANGVNQGSIEGVQLGTTGPGLVNALGVVFAGASDLWDVFPNCGALSAGNCISGSPGGSSNIMFSGKNPFSIGGATAVTCAPGSPTASFAVTNGIVTHC